jgi:mRNA interferase MazF
VGVPSAGAVVLVRFPFSDLSGSKLRPAIVLADAGRGDFILCQITSQSYSDPIAVEIAASGLSSGVLRKTSYARPGKLFTANDAIMARQIGTLTAAKLSEISDAVISVLSKNKI